MKIRFLVSLLLYILAICSPCNRLIARDNNILNRLHTRRDETIQHTHSLYLSLLEGLFDTEQQPATQNDAALVLEPWILELFGQHLQYPYPSCVDELDVTTQASQTPFSLLSLSLQEYRKKSKTR